MIMLKINSNSNLETVASAITSDFIGDETITVTRHLRELLNDAETFGCAFTRAIPDQFGGSVTVVATPSIRRDSWSF